jgi:hypothetical protein
MSEIKFCSHCRHCEPDTRFDNEEARTLYARCAVAPLSDSAFLSPTLQRRMYCSTARQLDYLCGREASKFEPVNAP